MARAVWSGALSFGLVAMPVQLFTATRSHTIRFHQIQRGTSDRVRNKRVNERTGEEVPPEEIVKGFDVGDGYVVVEPEELDEIAPGRSQGLEITGFVDLGQVEPTFFDRTYYLGPREKGYDKVYSLLLEALTRSHKAGIATFVMRNREYLVALKAERDVLALHTLHWADEVRDPRREIANLPERTEVADRELQTAVQLVDALSMEWNPDDYHDTYQERVLRLVEAKRTGETVEKAAAPPRSTNVIDLMDALQASVDQARASRQAAGRADEEAGEDQAGEDQAEGDQAGRKEREEGGKDREAAKKSSGRRPTRLQDAAEKRQGKKAAGRPTRKSAGKSTARQPSKTEELAGLSKSELYQRASEANVPGRSSMSRDELVQALSRAAGRRRARAS